MNAADAVPAQFSVRRQAGSIFTFVAHADRYAADRHGELFFLSIRDESMANTGPAWAKVTVGRPKIAAKPQAEPRIDPFVTPSRQATSPKRAVRRRTGRTTRVALPAFG